MNLPGSVPDPEDRGRITSRNVRGSEDLIGVAVMAVPVRTGVVMAEPAVPMGVFAQPTIPHQDAIVRIALTTATNAATARRWDTPQPSAGTTPPIREALVPHTVSYTHLTLPTILLV